MSNYFFHYSKIFLLFFILFYANIFSVPFNGQIIKLKQPDGTIVSVKVWGDEFYRDMESLDGYTLIREQDTGWITYAELSPDGNEYQTTGVKYDSNKTFEEVLKQTASTPAYSKLMKLKKKIRINKEAKIKKIEKMRKEIQKLLKQKETDNIKSLYLAPFTTTGIENFAPRPGVYVERKGVYKGLTILIEFPDERATIPRSEIENYLNQIGYTGFGNKGSIRDYFRDISSNKLDYINIVTDYY
ncbi:MAG: hypothetical protein N3E50_09250, partial [Candidatus Goldbacteria bacterium]|nr:hypothetical protein [Candidatus Goldiibacteriota bacterium]